MEASIPLHPWTRCAAVFQEIHKGGLPPSLSNAGLSDHLGASFVGVTLPVPFPLMSSKQSCFSGSPLSTLIASCCPLAASRAHYVPLALLIYPSHFLHVSQGSVCAPDEGFPCGCFCLECVMQCNGDLGSFQWLDVK